MGNFYTNYTLRGPGQREIAAFLDGRPAIVTPEQEGCVVVFDKISEEQDQHAIGDLGSRVSKWFNCAVLAVQNHDDDILWYQLFLNGKLTDEYDSTPGFFDPEAEPSPPKGGEAQKLCGAFGVSNVGEIEEILRRPCFGENAYRFAVERHVDLARVLGIPTFGVCAGYHYICEGQLPEGLDPEDLIWVR